MRRQTREFLTLGAVVAGLLYWVYVRPRQAIDPQSPPDLADFNAKRMQAGLPLVDLETYYALTRRQ